MNGVFGMDFDSNGVLWYVVTSLNNYEENLEFGIPADLFRWDITRGGKPEFMGVAGTPECVRGWNSEVVCTNTSSIRTAHGSCMSRKPCSRRIRRISSCRRLRRLYVCGGRWPRTRSKTARSSGCSGRGKRSAVSAAMKHLCIPDQKWDDHRALCTLGAG